MLHNVKPSTSLIPIKPIVEGFTKCKGRRWISFFNFFPMILGKYLDGTHWVSWENRMTMPRGIPFFEVSHGFLHSTTHSLNKLKESLKVFTIMLNLCLPIWVFTLSTLVGFFLGGTCCHLAIPLQVGLVPLVK